MGPMSECAVDSVLRAVSLGVCLMNADSSFVVAQVIPPLRVSSSSMQEGTSEAQKEGKMKFRHTGDRLNTTRRHPADTGCCS